SPATLFEGSVGGLAAERTSTTPRRRHSPGVLQSICSPHPNPLPRGEGAASFAPWKADNGGLFQRAENGSPLPRERAGVRGRARSTSRVSARAQNCRTLRVLRHSRRFPIRILKQIARFSAGTGVKPGAQIDQTARDHVTAHPLRALDG